MLNKYQSVKNFRGMKVDSGQYWPRLHETGVSENDIVFGDSETKYPSLEYNIQVLTIETTVRKQ